MTDKLRDAAQLLPCPFCGGEPERMKKSLDERFAYANEVTYWCKSCGCYRSARGDTSKPGYADNSTVEARALAAWNTRAALAQQDAQAVDFDDAYASTTMALVEDYAKAVHDGDDAACSVLRQTIKASLEQAAPTPPAPKPLGWLDRKAVECLQGAELNWMPAWNRPTSADPVPIFLSPIARATLTASEILNMTPESIPAEHDGALLEYARAVIEAYERKNGLKP